MGLLDAGAEEPKSKALRYVVSGVALVIFLCIAVWYFFRYTPEKHTVERFMNAVVTGDTQQAYQIWHPHPSFPIRTSSVFGDQMVITARSRLIASRARKCHPRVAAAS